MIPRISLSLAALLCFSPAWADIYKCVDEAGHITYTNTKASGRGCSLLARDQAVSSVPGPGPSRPAATPQNSASPSAAGFRRSIRAPKRRVTATGAASSTRNWPTSSEPSMLPDGILPPRKASAPTSVTTRRPLSACSPTRTKCRSTSATSRHCARKSQISASRWRLRAWRVCR